MKISDVIDEFKKGIYPKGMYFVYALNPIVAADGNLYADGTYIIKDQDAFKRKYAKINNRKKIELLANIIIGD